MIESAFPFLEQLERGIGYTGVWKLPPPWDDVALAGGRHEDVALFQGALFGNARHDFAQAGGVDQQHRCLISHRGPLLLAGRRERQHPIAYQRVCLCQGDFVCLTPYLGRPAGALNWITGTERAPVIVDGIADCGHLDAGGLQGQPRHSPCRRGGGVRKWLGREDGDSLLSEPIGKNRQLLIVGITKGQGVADGNPAGHAEIAGVIDNSLDRVDPNFAAIVQVKIDLPVEAAGEGEGGGQRGFDITID